MSWTDFESYVKLLASLGVVTALAASIKYVWNRRRWRTFKRKCQEWNRLAKRHPKEMDDDDWQILVEQFLAESLFSPFEIETLHALATMTAKELVASTILPV